MVGVDAFVWVKTDPMHCNGANSWKCARRAVSIVRCRHCIARRTNPSILTFNDLNCNEAPPCLESENISLLNQGRGRAEGTDVVPPLANGRVDIVHSKQHHHHHKELSLFHTLCSLGRDINGVWFAM